MDQLRIGRRLSVLGLTLLAGLALTSRTREAMTPAQESRSAAVGFTVVAATRGGRAGQAFPLAVWYPARAARGSRVRLTDYLALSPVPREGQGAEAQLAGMLGGAGVARDEVQRWLHAQGDAYRDAPPTGVREPLVVVAPGNDEGPADQVALAESLVKRGYVVVAMDFPARLGTAPMATEADMGRMAEVQADDLAAAVHAVGARADVDTGTVIVVGHSFGARGALLLAMRSPLVRGVVSLDGGIGSATGQEAMRAAPSFAASRPVAPVLHVYEELDAWMHPDHSLLAGLDSTTVWLVKVQAMHHQHFTSLGTVPAGYAAIRSATGHQPRTSGEAAEVTALVGRFIDALVRGGTFGESSGTVALPVRRLPRASPRGS